MGRAALGRAYGRRPCGEVAQRADGRCLSASGCTTHTFLRPRRGSRFADPSSRACRLSGTRATRAATPRAARGRLVAASGSGLIVSPAASDGPGTSCSSARSRCTSRESATPPSSRHTCSTERGERSRVSPPNPGVPCHAIGEHAFTVSRPVAPPRELRARATQRTLVQPPPPPPRFT